MKVAAVILAAGQSTRMKSELTKVLHPLAGRSIVSYPIAAAKKAGAEKIYVVRGPKQDDLKDHLKDIGAKDVIQKEPNGTAGAVLAAASVLKTFDGYVLILCGDAPLVQGDVLKKFVHEASEKKATLGVLTMVLDTPKSYGRIVRDLGGNVVRIVEERDASEEEKNIREVNSGVIIAERSWLFKTLSKVGNENAKGEFYLTDLVDLAAREEKAVLGFKADDPDDLLGINTRIDLAKVASIMKRRINEAHMLAGVGILDGSNTHIDAGAELGNDTTVMPYGFILGNSKIGAGCIIENGVVIKDSVVGDGVHIKAYSVIEDSEISEEAVIGPFARLRPLSKVGRGAKVGNFVELKKTEMKAGAKASHLTYLGDAVVGAKANIGCGTITCNYDGVQKFKTVIGDGVFVGSDVQFIAPVTIGSNAFIGAGSTITKDVPADSLALSRTPQSIVKGWVKRRKTK